ncbi:MAG: phosphotransferase [Halioglobus sp.]
MSDMLDIANIALLAAREGGRLALDALGDGVGSALPLREEAVLQPAVLARFFEEGATGILPGTVELSSVSSRGVPSVSSNCQTFVLDLEYVEGSEGPESVFLKVPMQSLATRWFLGVTNSWRLETHFFRYVAPGLPIRTPVTYAALARGSRFFVVQENLRDDPSVTLFTNPDMMSGPPLELVRRCLDTFARLHSAHAGLDRAAQQALLPLEYHPFLSPAMGVVSKALNRIALGPARKKVPGVITPTVERAYRRTLQHWDTLLEDWFSGPLSLLHGDSHLGNFFVSGDEMGMLDFQAAHWGKGLRDVQYFLILALPDTVLAEHERELVAYYALRREHYGAPVDAEQAWRDYRSLSYHALMTMVVSVGLGALNEEQDALMAELLRRAAVALERLDYAGWLDGYLADASPT